MDMVFITLGVFILGTLIGSFLNVVIYRIPKEESIVFPASHCQSCQTPLKWYHNIPILSWLSLGGKCAFCKESISKQYPSVEFITGLIFVVLFLKLGLVWYLPFILASFTALFALVMIDFKYYAVPDSVNFFALAMALIQPDFMTAAIDAAIAALALFLLGLSVSFVAKKEAMGSADVIVAGTMAALLGFPNFFVALFLSALLAMIPSLLAKDTMVPFVPFLALATFIVYLFDAETGMILNWIMYG
ncbi:MAG: prepilin peptidase [Campylobacterota bacterium]|nr:prepilin peptidase [Campylobacterota bacterium]